MNLHFRSQGPASWHLEDRRSKSISAGLLRGLAVRYLHLDLPEQIDNLLRLMLLR